MSIPEYWWQNLVPRSGTDSSCAVHSPDYWLDSGVKRWSQTLLRNHRFVVVFLLIYHQHWRQTLWTEISHIHIFIQDMTNFDIFRHSHSTSLFDYQKLFYRLFLCFRPKQLLCGIHLVHRSRCSFGPFKFSKPLLCRWFCWYAVRLMFIKLSLCFNSILLLKYFIITLNSFNLFFQVNKSSFTNN